MSSKEKTKPVTTGFVIYTDGGARPNPGNAGWGLHGYLFTTEESKKGHGLSGHYLSVEGYYTNQEAEELKQKRCLPRQAYPIHYVDGYGSFIETTTNNVGELVAVTRALEYAADYVSDIVKIMTDSENTVKMLNEWMTGWKNNGWRRKDGSPVANIPHLIELDKAVTTLKERGVVLIFEWIESHAGFHGNTLADKYATAGVNASKAGVFINQIETTAADGYWKSKVEKNPFISARRLYFNTGAGCNEPGKYYLGDHGKEDDLLGTKTAEGAYGYVELAQPDQWLELIRNKVIGLADTANAIMMVRLDAVYNQSIYRDIDKFGEYAFVRSNPFRLDLEGLDKEPIAREFKPPMIAYRAIESLDGLELIYRNVLNNQGDYVKTNITDILYEKVPVSKKNEAILRKQLKAQYCVGFATLPVIVYQNVETTSSGEPKTKSITLTLGIDIPDRNTLKRMEELDPEVYVITWKESINAFRYATVIFASGNGGIWAGVHSNLRLITK